MRKAGWLLVAVLLGFSVHAANAKVFHSKESALKVAFPKSDKVIYKNIFLSASQLAMVQKIARVKVRSKLIRVYLGIKKGRVTSYGFIDTHVVRTLPETFMMVVGNGGAIKAIHILAFQEPLEYLPSKRWLKQFSGKKLSPKLRIRYQVSGIAGSTMSAMAVTRGVRRVLALHRVLFTKSAPVVTSKLGKTTP